MQLKKLVRGKTKQPMIITDMPRASFDNIMNIIGSLLSKPLPKTERDNEYISILQDQLTKFCMGIPTARSDFRKNSRSFVDRLICVLGATKAILTDQERNFIIN